MTSMFADEQHVGIAELLHRKWEEARQFGPPRPDIQVPQVQREAWGQGLSDDQALVLIQLGLDLGEWYIGPPIRSAQGIKGYQYTDAATAANARGFYPFTAP